MEKTYFIGVDVSKNELDFAVVTSNKVLFHQEVTNDKTGIDSFIKSLKKQTDFNFGNSLFCMEFTGIYNNILLNYLTVHKASIWVENARQIKDSMGTIRGKTDKLDSILIAQYSYKNRENPRLWSPKREIIQELDRLTAIRSRLKNAVKMLETPLKDSKNFIGKQAHKNTRNACQESINALKKDIKSIEKQIDEIIKSDPELKHLFEIITSVKGISKVTATEILITTNEFKDIDDPKKFGSYAGCVPFERSSGKRKGKPKVSPFANKKLKSLLHMAAMSAIKYCKELKAYYDRKVNEGKNKMLVINNVRNKLILRVFACVNKNQKYNENYNFSLA
jgi:transposase